MTDAKKHIRTSRFGALLREAELQLVRRAAYVGSGRLEEERTEVHREQEKWRGLSIWTTENPLPIYLTAEEAVMLQEFLTTHQDTFRQMVLEERNALEADKQRQKRTAIEADLASSRS